ncbi:hypothetical protein N7478_006261 [Penicillium angulare]|uniref:uncharacterized protein n=1 Tax=Penicillium angulare TaxID=116970 RepID=UPI002540AB9D|nr:uncharacterized protein N7478_006261 [Penicillium angulare]KAJ5280889.1 hypothetical protein N7478_006261 [Penicillium angulare]
MQSPAFAAAWANIQELSLQWTEDTDFTVDDFVREAAQTIDLRVGSVQYTSRLKKLDLDFELKSETLLSFLQAVKNTLRVLSISHSFMVKGGWDRVLKGLGSELPLLQSIKLQFLRQRLGRLSLVHFPRLSDSLVVSSFIITQFKGWSLIRRLNNQAAV